MKIHERSFFWVALAFAALCAPLILTKGGGYSWDEASYHLPAIRQIRAHWPRLCLAQDSLSATAPGYHYFLATLSLGIGTGLLNLRLANWAVSLALLWFLWRWFGNKRLPVALGAILPLAASNFFVKSASWVVTDNPALLGMAWVVAGSLADEDEPSVWGQGIVAAATTFVRQLYVWLAVPVALQALRHKGAARLRVAAALLPIGVLALLYLSWGGLVPEQWEAAEGARRGAAAGCASIAYLLSVFAVLGAAYYLAAASPRSGRQELRTGWVWMGAALGLVVSVAGPTDFSYSEGRWGGYLWALIAGLPSPWHRSVFLAVMAPAGGGLLGAMFARLAQSRGLGRASMWGLSYCAWAVAFYPSRQVFHRYYEPATLVFLILWLGLMTDEGDASPGRKWPLAALAAAQLALTLAFVYGRTFLPG
jgi:hypothetical protein